MNTKTWTLTTDDSKTLKTMAQKGLIVEGPKLKFSFRFFRWMYVMTIQHLNRSTMILVLVALVLGACSKQTACPTYASTSKPTASCIMH